MKDIDNNKNTILITTYRSVEKINIIKSCNLYLDEAHHCEAIKFKKMYQEIYNKCDKII